MNGLGSGILEIAMALIGVALLALLVGNASKTTAIISQAGDSFNNLLQTVTLQNGMGNFGSGGSIY
jgi:uncharacterized protein YoxC